MPERTKAPVKYQRFEELPVWNDAIELAVRLLEISQAGRLNGVGDLKSQLERSVISISNIIAEGFERGTNNELITFLYIAKGSSCEVRSMLLLLGRLPKMEDLRLRSTSCSGGSRMSPGSSGAGSSRSRIRRTRADDPRTRRRDRRRKLPSSETGFWPKSARSRTRRCGTGTTQAKQETSRSEPTGAIGRRCEPSDDTGTHNS